jgi:O-antigen/teichoic acid export membrane protein
MPLWRMILTAINLVGARFGGAGIGLASQILLARLLPQADVGVIFMGMSAAAVLSQVATGGYPPLAMVYLPRYYALGRRNLVLAFQQAYWRDTLVVTALVALIVATVVMASPVVLLSTCALLS